MAHDRQLPPSDRDDAPDPVPPPAPQPSPACCSLCGSKTGGAPPQGCTHPSACPQCGTFGMVPPMATAPICAARHSEAGSRARWYCTAAANHPEPLHAAYSMAHKRPHRLWRTDFTPEVRRLVTLRARDVGVDLRASLNIVVHLTPDLDAVQYDGPSCDLEATGTIGEIAEQLRAAGYAVLIDQPTDQSAGKAGQ